MQYNAHTKEYLTDLLVVHLKKVPRRTGKNITLGYGFHIKLVDCETELAPLSLTHRLIRPLQLSLQTGLSQVKPHLRRGDKARNLGLLPLPNRSYTKPRENQTVFTQLVTLYYVPKVQK